MSEPLQSNESQAAPPGEATQQPIRQPAAEASKPTKKQGDEKVQQEEEPINQRFLEDNLEEAEKLKAQGNIFFKEEEFCEAIGNYQQALRYAAKQHQKLRAILYSNIAICHSKLDNWKEALAYCQKAVKSDSSYTKAQLNLAQYLEKTDNLDEALEQNRKLLQMFPKDYKFAIKIKELEKRIDQRNEKQKKEVLDGLKNIGNSVLGYFGLSLDNFKLEQGNGGGYNVSFKQ